MLLIASSAASSQETTGKNGLVATESVVTILLRLQVAGCLLCVGRVVRLLAVCGSSIRVNQDHAGCSAEGQRAYLCSIVRGPVLVDREIRMKSLPVILLLTACWGGGCRTKSGQHASRDVPSHDVESGSQRMRSQSVQPLALSTGKVTVEQLLQMQMALLEKQESIVADQAERARQQHLATEQMQEMDQLVQQQQKMVVAQVALSRRQEAMVDQLKELTIGVNGALGQLVMEFEMLQPKAKWHARQIEGNHNP